jgi:putative DNA primase/helicase
MELENQIDAAIQRLSRLSALEYDQVRKQEAKALGVRSTTLDAAIRDARKNMGSDDLPFPVVEPWHEPTDPAQLLSDIVAVIRRFIVCEKETAQAATLWVAMTWFIEVVQVAPLAVITAPEKRCGKTLLLSLLGRLSAKAITASSISPAALFRTIDSWCPTLLIDEADAFIKGNEELRGLLNSGHTRESAYVIRTQGENFVPTKFNTWGAKALAGIGQLSDTLMDRAIVLELRRKLPHEKVDRIRDADPDLFCVLRQKLARFAENYRDRVRQARPPLPQNLNDRAQDNWEPLLAIALTAGSEWLKIGCSAALKLSGGEHESQTTGIELLSDIREIFVDRDKVSSAELIGLLCDDEEKPWATFNQGKPITPRQVAKHLREYGIYSRTIRIGVDTAKGYIIDQFKEAFSRYLSRTPKITVTTSQVYDYNKLAVTETLPRDVTRYGNKIPGVTCKPASGATCDGVTDKTPEKGPQNIKIIDLQTGEQISIAEPEAWLTETGELITQGSCDDLAATIVRLSADNLALQRDLLTRYCQTYDQQHIADLWEAWEERAAIMEYDGGLCRDEAEYQAAKRLHLLAFMDGRNCGRSQNLRRAVRCI